MSTSSPRDDPHWLDRPALDNELLRTFVAVVECGGYTAAARMLNRTQSAVSLQIKRLEDQLATPLFEHPRRQVTLTQQGERILPFARRLIEYNAELLAAIDGSRKAGRVRIGSNNYHATAILPALLARFRRAHPDVLIDLQTGSSSSLEAGLGPLYDIIINFSRVENHPGILVSRHHMFWVTSRENPVHMDDPLPVALPPEGTLLRRLALDSLLEARRSWRLAYESASVDATLAAVAAGLAVSICASARLPQYPGLVPLGAEAGFPALPMCGFTLECADRYLSPATCLLRDYLIATMGEADDDVRDD